MHIRDLLVELDREIPRLEEEQKNLDANFWKTFVLPQQRFMEARARRNKEARQRNEDMEKVLQRYIRGSLGFRTDNQAADAFEEEHVSDLQKRLLELQDLDSSLQTTLNDALLHKKKSRAEMVETKVHWW